MARCPRPPVPHPALFHAETIDLEVDTALAIAGSAGVIDDPAALLGVGELCLSRQTAALGSGSTDMAHNIVGERVLGFPANTPLTTGYCLRWHCCS